MSCIPYSGTRRKLLLGFDIGTTHSGVAYSFLDPGEVPQINLVTRYLNNPNTGLAVPSDLYYDQEGNFRGIEGAIRLDDNEGLLRLRCWKPILRPAGLPAAPKNQTSTDLPPGKTIIDIFSDFMQYLLDSTKALFISSYQNGELRWNSISNNLELVLTHPNGWGGSRKNQLRAAAAQANIVPDTSEGYARVHFVTEGEAELYFCATHTLAGETLKLGDKVVVIRAGERAINISYHTVINKTPLQVEELFQPQCLFQGGESVTARARESFSEKSRGSRFHTPENIAAFTQQFDRGLKRVFSDPEARQFVKFASSRDNDPQCGIKAGKLALAGMEVSHFFEPSIQSIVNCVRGSFAGAPLIGSFAFLTGEFISSPWLTEQLDQRLSNLGLKFFKPGMNTNRAITVGAVSFYIDRFAGDRTLVLGDRRGHIARFTYGTACSTFYRPLDAEHAKRKHKSFIDELGHTCVPSGFATILSKGTWVNEDQEFRKRLRVVREGTTGESGALMRIIKYDGDKREPQWMDVEPGKFKALCYVVADIFTIPPMSILPGSKAMRYYYEFDLVLFIGAEELRAQVRWMDFATGAEKRIDAEVVYEGAE